MATSLILFLLIIATILLLFKRIKSGLTILLFTIIGFIGAGNGLIPDMFLRQLQGQFLSAPRPAWKNTNAIVLLGAGTIKLPGVNEVKPALMAYSRINKAAQLYFDCVKSHHRCSIIISGGDALKTGESEAAIYQNALLELGVNKSNIILEPNSLNTYKNAEFTSSIVKQKHFDQVVLVTSGIHLKRALLYFSFFDIHAQPAMADYLAPRIGMMSLGYNFAMMDFAIHEYLGMARFHVYHFLGWNKEVTSPGRS